MCHPPLSQFCVSKSPPKEVSRMSQQRVVTLLSQFCKLQSPCEVRLFNNRWCSCGAAGDLVIPLAQGAVGFNH